MFLTAKGYRKKGLRTLFTWVHSSFSGHFYGPVSAKRFCNPAYAGQNGFVIFLALQQDNLQHVPVIH